MKITAEPEDWQEIVCCGLENQQIDFKAPQNWNTIGRVGRAKFARHAMALANTLGGYVVIGVGEDENGNPRDYIGMSEEEAGSFDPSAVGQTLSAFADPPIALDVVRPVVDGRRYVVLVIYPFRDMPHVCSNSCEFELQRGAFYIRTPDARSKVADKSSEMHLIIRRALRNQRQMLGRMLRGILYEDRQADTPDQTLMPPFIERCRRLAMERFGKNILHDRPYLEVICFPKTPFTDISLTDVRRASEGLERPAFQDLPWGGSASMQADSFATNDSICQLLLQGGHLSVLTECYRNGLFYLASPFPDGQSENGRLDSDRLAEAVAAIAAAFGQYYLLLNHSDALLAMTIRIPNSNGVTLVGSGLDPKATLACRIMDIEVTGERTAGDLEGGGAIDTAMHLFTEICERFNAYPDKADLAAIKYRLR